MIDFIHFKPVQIMREISKSFKVNIYLVGGAVRDILMNRTPFDFDFSCEVDEKCHNDISNYISNNYGIDMKYNEFYHTAKFFLKDYEIDFVMARRESYEGIGVKPIVQPANIYEDIRRRDFTINTIAWNVMEDGFEIIDVFNGYRDIFDKRIRVLHNESFKDDPTRIFRGIKYAARFDFHFDSYTERLIEKAVENGYIYHIDADKVKNEILVLCLEENPINSLKLVQRYNLIFQYNSDNIFINSNFDKILFKSLKNSEKLVLIFYNNTDDVYLSLKKDMNLSSDIISDMKNMRELQYILTMDDDYVYNFFIEKQKKLNFNTILCNFYSDNRVLNYIKYKDRLKINKQEIQSVDRISRKEYLRIEKFKLLKKYIYGGKIHEELYNK